MQRRCTTKIMLPGLLVTILFTFSGVGAPTDRQPIFLGVLEPTSRDQRTELSMAPFVVRVVFEYNSTEWKKLPDGQENAEPLDLLLTRYPKELKWTNLFSEQGDVAFRTHLPSRWAFYADVGIEIPDQAKHVDVIRESSDFHYWTGSASFRPIVVTSGPLGKVRDPDHWKLVEAPTMPSGTLRRLAREFRRALKPIPFYCGPQARPDYSDDQIVVKTVYRSFRGDELISMALATALANDCEQVRRDQWDVQWFYVDGKRIHFLGRSLELVVTGDFDNDGRSEALFHKSGYDYDGYLLAYDRLRRLAEFRWTYH